MVQDKAPNWQTFDEAKRITINTKPNYQAVYEDNLVYKF